MRSEFEKSIAENNTEIINKISTMFFLLNIEDNTFDKVINVYEKKLEENLEKFIDKLDKEKANGTNFKSIENYKFNFYSLFVDYLS